MRRTINRNSSLPRGAGLVSVVALVAAAMAGDPSAPVSESQGHIAAADIGSRVAEARERVRSLAPAVEPEASRGMRMAQWRNV
jgi:hypothetical protein